MSIITKKQILERVKEGSLTFTPEIDEFQIQAHSVDLRLGYSFLIPKSWQITKLGRQALNIDHFDKNHTPYFETVELEEGQFFELLPGEYVLVSTLESIKVPKDLMGILYPRSSTNRRGLSIDLTGIIDSGYEGQLVIPIRNNTNSQVVRVYPGERFCQVTFEELTEQAVTSQSRYHKRDIADGFILRKGGKQESEEIKLISTGKISELKRKYKLNSK